jgi:sulfur relay (sulfurtransferase) DsrF/TusC family protein
MGSCPFQSYHQLTPSTGSYFIVLEHFPKLYLMQILIGYSNNSYTINFYVQDAHLQTRRLNQTNCFLTLPLADENLSK